MKIGYARGSTKEQKLSLQVNALEKAGCNTVFRENITGSTRKRPQLEKMLEQLREGDVVVIWKLDRLGRSIKDLVQLVAEIQEKGAGLLSLNDHIDTTTPQGKLTFHLFAALAEFERGMTRERTMAGLESARARGRTGGRPKGLSKKALDKTIIAEQLYNGEAMTVTEICDHISISKMTLYKYLRHRSVEIGSYNRKEG